MAYDAFDRATPEISDDRDGVVLETNQNLRALCDMVGIGADGHLAWSMAITAGTNDVPTTIVLSNGTLRRRFVLTWVNNTITQVVASFSSDSGSNYDTIGTFTFTFTGDDVTGGNVGSFVLLMLVRLICEARNTRDNLSTHASATGTGVHGLGTMSTQAKTAVDIDGGNIDGTLVGATTPALGTFAQAREVHQTTAFATPTTTVSWADRASTDITATGSGAVALAFANLPPAGVAATMVVELVNGGLRTWTWPSGTQWAGGTPPTLTSSGRDVLVFFTRDGGASYRASVFGKAFA